MSAHEDWAGADDVALSGYLDGARGDWRSDDWQRDQTDTYQAWWDLGAIDATYFGEHDLYDTPGETPGPPGRSGE